MILFGIFMCFIWICSLGSIILLNEYDEENNKE